MVQERPDDLLLHTFFLNTNLNKFDWPPEKVLAIYRKRGSARGAYGRGEISTRGASLLDRSRRFRCSRCNGPQRSESVTEPLGLPDLAWTALHPEAANPPRLEPEPDARAGAQNRFHHLAKRQASHCSPW